MSLYKRKDSSFWWVKVTVRGRPPVQESTGTADRARAAEYEAKLRARLWDEVRLGVKPTRMWEEAVVRYLAETSHKASQVSDKYHLRWLNRFLGGVELAAINRSLLDRVMTARAAEDVKPSSVNRTMEVVRAVLNKAAQEWEWLDRVPKVRMLAEPKRRIRWITVDEAERLLAALPAHWAAMARFSLETGLRRSNVTGLVWSQVDLASGRAWIHPDQAKARKAIGVPLSPAAVAVIREQIGKHLTHVFSCEGRPLVRINTTTWLGALRRAGIENFRWHDLRHTWASWHVQRGTPLHVLQELGGWESVEMVRRYAHLSSDHLAEYVAKFAEQSSLGGAGGATIQLRA